jgi:hypothetical protein
VASLPETATTKTRHSSVTTHRYVEANMAMKEEALARLEAPATKMPRYQMRFLEAL